MDVIEKIMGTKHKTKNKSMKSLFSSPFSIEKDLMKALKPKGDVVSWNRLYHQKLSSPMSGGKTSKSMKSMYSVMPKGMSKNIYSVIPKGISKSMYSVIPKGISKSMYSVIPKGMSKNLYNRPKDMYSMPKGMYSFSRSGGKIETLEKAKNLVTGKGWSTDAEADVGGYGQVIDVLPQDLGMPVIPPPSVDAPPSTWGIVKEDLARGWETVKEKAPEAWEATKEKAAGAVEWVGPKAAFVGQTLTGIPLTEEAKAKQRVEQEHWKRIREAAKKQAWMDIEQTKARDLYYKTMVEQQQKNLTPRQLGLMIARRGLYDPFMLGYMDPRYQKGFGKSRDYYDETIIGQLKAQASQTRDAFFGGMNTFQSGLGAAIGGASDDVSYKIGFGPGYAGTGLGVMESVQVGGDSLPFSEKVRMVTGGQGQSPYSGLGMASMGSRTESMPTGFGMMGIQQQEQIQQPMLPPPRQTTTMAPIAQPTIRAPVGVAPQQIPQSAQAPYQGMVWSPLSKKYVNYPRGPYRIAKSPKAPVPIQSQY